MTGVTAGSAGSMLIAEDGTILRCPAFRDLPVVDSTGAGDAYHCGFGVRYLETGDLRECMRFASAFAGLKCGKLGARAGLPTRKEVDEFLRNH